MKDYTNSKLKIFKLQKRGNYSFIKEKYKQFLKREHRGKLIFPKIQNYKKLKSKIKNSYAISNINDENMSFVLALSKCLKISEKSL